MKVLTVLWENSAEPGLAKPVLTLPSLSVFSDSFPQKHSEDLTCHTGADLVSEGGRKVSAHV